MAHKKAGGSTRNGRDSNPKMLGVKCTAVKNRRWQHHRASTRY